MEDSIEVARGCNVDCLSDVIDDFFLPKFTSTPIIVERTVGEINNRSFIDHQRAMKLALDQDRARKFHQIYWDSEVDEFNLWLESFSDDEGTYIIHHDSTDECEDNEETIILETLPNSSNSEGSKTYVIRPEATYLVMKDESEQYSSIQMFPKYLCNSEVSLVSSCDSAFHYHEMAEETSFEDLSDDSEFFSDESNMITMDVTQQSEEDQFFSY